MYPTEVAIIVIGLVVLALLATTTIYLFRRLNSVSLRSFLFALVAYFRLLLTILGALFLFGLFLAVGGLVGFVLWIVSLFVVIEVWRKQRAARQYGLLWMIKVASERSIPLAPAVDAFSKELGSRFGRRCRELAALLNAGVALPDALEQCPTLIPTNAMPIVRVGCELNALPKALQRTAEIHDAGQPIWASLHGKVNYLLLAPTFGLLVLTFVMLKIVPSFQKIFADYGMALPPSTRCLIRASCFAITEWYILQPLLLLGAAVLFYALLRYFGWIDWNLPGIAYFARRLDAADILDVLSFVADQGRPLPTGILSLAKYYPKESIRWRLHQTLIDISNGGDWCESLQRRRLIGPPEFAILRAAQRVGNLPWALREMADSLRRRCFYQVNAVSQLLFPPMIVLMGLVVMFICVALFMPLVSLITRLS